MIKYNDKNYELKYNMGRIEMIEKSTTMPTLALINTTGGYFGLSDLKLFISMALKEEGSDVFVMPKQAMEIAANFIEESGYANACSAVIEALERDCPFFFRAG